MEVTVELGLFETIVTWIPPTSSDISGTDQLTLQSHRPGSVFVTTATTVQYLFTDASGNSATYEFCINFIIGRNI